MFSTITQAYPLAHNDVLGLAMPQGSVNSHVKTTSTTINDVLDNIGQVALDGMNLAQAAISPYLPIANKEDQVLSEILSFPGPGQNLAQ